MVILQCLLGFLLLSSLIELEAFSVSKPPVRRTRNDPFRTTLLRSSTATSHGSFEFPGDDSIPGERSNTGSSSSTGSGSSSSRRAGISSSELRKMSLVRQQRLASEQDEATRFVSGAELHSLRQQVLGLRQELDYARKLQARDRVQQLERAILKAQKLDAEFIYEVSVERMETCQKLGKFHQAEEYRVEAVKARKALPQFNLEGLWVGKYGGHGFEMINVTYAGDVLIARKVTGDQNVPQGEITFQVDLSPKSSRQHVLDPIELGIEASEQWGTKHLDRFAGQGQVAAEGFVNSQWMDGQLILVNEYFSFAWLPIAHQVFFGRPSSELTLKLLRKQQAAQSSKYNNRFSSSGDKAREYLSKCWEETELLDEEMEVNGGIFRSHNQHDYYHQEGCFE